MLTATLLGTGGTQPLPDRALAAAAISVQGRNILFDCGEGTQTAARRYGVSLYKTAAVLLTHYHGDHIFGLPGLWQTMAAQERTAPLIIAGPPGLQEMVRALYSVAGPLPFDLQLMELADCRGDFSVESMKITAFPLAHRVPCCGYAVNLARAGRFDTKKAAALGVPVRLWSRLQRGESVDGYTPDMVLGAERRGLKFVYATDTCPCPALQSHAQDADLLCMDATYADDSDMEKARRYGHSTCRQAGALAADARVRRLWLTHYSAAVTDTAAGLAAARTFFPTAEAGFDGKQITLTFDEEHEVTDESNI